jgi:hypothetical protein
MADKIEMHDIDFNELCEAIDRCKGNVYLITDDGDKLNLKSKLCQLLGLSKLLTCGHVAEAKLICENPEDESLLFRYNLYRHFM